MLKHLNWRPETPNSKAYTNRYLMLKHLNWRPETPCTQSLYLATSDVEASQLEAGNTDRFQASKLK